MSAHPSQPPNGLPPLLTSLPTRASSRSARSPNPNANTIPNLGVQSAQGPMISPTLGSAGLQPLQSPFTGLPPLLVPPSANHPQFPQSPSHQPQQPPNTHVLPPGAAPPVSPEAFRPGNVDGSANARGMKTYESPLIGLPPLLAPVPQESRNGKPTIPALPVSPSLDMTFFTGTGTENDHQAPAPAYFPPHPAPLTPASTSSSHRPNWNGKSSAESLQSTSSSGSLTSLTARGGTRLPALPPPPNEALPLPPRAPQGLHLGAGRTGSPVPGARRSPSPLSPFSGHGEIKPQLQPQLQGLGLGSVRVPDGGRSVSSPVHREGVRPVVQLAASKYKDLPPIVTTAAQPEPAPRSVSLSSPHPTGVRKPPAPQALDLKQSNSNHRSHPQQLLSPGMCQGVTSPGFSPTNVAVDSLIEEMQEDSHPPSNPSEGPVRKTSILDRPRPRALSRSSSYRADPSRTPTSQQTTFAPQQDTSFPEPVTNPYFRPTIQLTDLIQDEGVQKALLPCLSIASFLALLGALDKRWRQSISGEVVGKWVVREWGLVLGPEVTWPGLGVWEGFLESLLHNPEAYPTYPAHFTPLLRHLSLSHTLIVLFLRSLPATAFPTIPPFPFEDDPSTASLPHSMSSLSLSHRTRTVSGPGSEHGGVGGGGGGAGSRPMFVPKAERVVELVMPEPLSALRTDSDSQELLASPTFPSALTSHQHKRRSSIGSASFVSWNKERRGSQPTSPNMPSIPKREGKKHSAPPPVSFPSAKRYVFKGFGEPSFTHSRTRNSFDGTGPGSIFSVDDAGGGRSLYGDSSGGSTFPSRYGPNRSRAFGEHSTTKQSLGRQSPSSSSLARFTGSAYDDRTNTSSPTFGRLRPSTPQPVEPAFQKPIPYVVGRVPILRVYVPLSEQIPDWPCAQGAQMARHELQRCGAWSKLRFGDVIINTALKDPMSSRHLMLFVPTMQPYLVPLEYRFSPEGHLPAYFDAFKVPPSYYYPLLAPPYIITPDLLPWADNAVNTVRLAFERSDITTTRGEKVVAKRYLHVCGFEITPGTSHLACEEWQGMVTLEAEGTAEGRASLLRRLGRAANESRIPAQRGPWEIIREKSLGGTVWLRLVPEKASLTSPG